MLERGRRDAEAGRHFQSHDSAHDTDERVVMHGVGNRIHDFTPDGGRRDLRAIGRVAGLARDRQWAQQKHRIKILKTCTEFARRVQRGEAVVLDERAAFAVVVVQIALRRRVEQAAKVVETMTIVAADGSVEGDGQRRGPTSAHWRV